MTSKGFYFLSLFFFIMIEWGKKRNPFFTRCPIKTAKIKRTRKFFRGKYFHYPHLNLNPRVLERELKNDVFLN